MSSAFSNEVRDVTVDAEGHDGTRLRIGATYRDFRYHFFNNASALTAPPQTIYKNPVQRTKENRDRRTYQLDPSAKLNAQLVTEIRRQCGASNLYQLAREEWQRDQNAKERERRTWQLRKRIEKAAPLMYEQLNKVDAARGVTRPSVDSEIRALLIIIHRYQKHGVDCDDSLNCACPDPDEEHGPGCDGPYNCTCGRIP